MNMPKMLAAAQVSMMIKQVVKDITGIDQKVHAAAIQCLLHAEATGDCTLMERLFKALPQASNGSGGYLAEGLKPWLRKFTPIVASGVDWKLRKNRKPDAWKIQEALDNPFWTLVAVQEAAQRMFSEKSIIDSLKALAARLTTNIEKGTFTGDPKHAQELMSNVIQAADKFEAASQVKAPKAV